jgi:N-acetylmuramoyl-L-alanine amidase
LAAGLALLLSAPASALYESPAVSPAQPAAAKPLAVILDPGHGGSDLGAVVKGRREKDIALSISLKVKAKLEELGAPVKITRDSDVFIPLDQRVADGSGWDGRVFVSLHLNAVRSKKAHGISVYAFGKDRHHIKRRRRRHKVPPLGAPPEEEARASNELAQAVVASLRAQGYDAAQAKAAFYVLKNPAVPSVLIELGYLSNPKEAAKLADDAYQAQLAEAVAVSLQSYFALNGEDASTPEIATSNRK